MTYVATPGKTDDQEIKKGRHIMPFDEDKRDNQNRPETRKYRCKVKESKNKYKYLIETWLNAFFLYTYLFFVCSHFLVIHIHILIIVVFVKYFVIYVNKSIGKKSV